MKPIFILLLQGLMLLAALGCNDKPNDDEKPIKITNGPAYFPMHDGDTWDYSIGLSIVKIHVDGDTTVNGYPCKRVLVEPGDDQAWSLTSDRFAQHRFECLWFDPPLEIPLNLERDKPHSFSSLGLISDECEADIDSLKSFGTITFGGYVNESVDGVQLDSCLRIDYDYTIRSYYKTGGFADENSAYSEIYGKGIGLIFDGDMHLDQAIIDGDTIPDLSQ